MEERLLRLLVRLHPADFRAKYGFQMMDAYRQRCADSEAGYLARVKMLADLGWGILLVRISRIRAVIGRRVLFGLPVAGGSSALAGACVAAVLCGPAEVVPREIDANRGTLGPGGAFATPAIVVGMDGCDTAG